MAPDETPGGDQPNAASLFSLAGSVAIVTGAARGIGLATARILASAGAQTVLSDLAQSDPVAAARSLAEVGLPVVGRAVDVTDRQQLEALVDFTAAEFGRIDTVVANAGVALDADDRLTTDAKLDTMFAIHVRSPLHLAELALPIMADGGGGSLILMSSLSGLRGNRTIGLYGITKAANAQLARNLAVQWGSSNVRVNAISPGVIDTEFARPITEDNELARQRLARTPLGRFGRPEHVAGTVLWLASPAGAFVTGQNIVVDGGTLISD